MIQVNVATGRVVRDQNGFLMPTDQAFSVDETNVFWVRLLRDGDVVAVTAATGSTATGGTATGGTANSSAGSSATLAAASTVSAGAGANASKGQAS